MGTRTRRALIEQRILDDGEVGFTALASEFSVSEMTIRRDIDLLEAKGVARRVYGGAISLIGKSTEPTFATRSSEAVSVKAHLAAAVVALLEAHETVILDSGSTVIAVARAIRGANLALTVVTPSLQAAIELADEPETTILLTGGRLRPGELSMIGPEAEETFRRYNCDTYVMGIAGVDAIRGVTEYHREEGAVKRAAAAAADRIIVVADGSKLGHVQLLNVAPLDAIDTLVTDGDPNDPTIVAAREAGVRVVCVAPSESGDVS